MLRELIEKREKLVADARSALDEIKKNTDEARAAELDKRHDDIMAEFDKVDAQIARERRMADAEKRIEERAAEERARLRPVPGGGEGRGQDNGEEVTYRSAFHRYVQVAGDMSALSDEERAALRAGVAPNEARAQVTGTGSAGGYTVPTELSNQIIISMKAWGPMYDEDICTVMNTTGGNPIDIPTVDDTSVPVAQHTEAGAVTDDGGSDATFGYLRIVAKAGFSSVEAAVLDSFRRHGEIVDAPRTFDVSLVPHVDHSGRRLSPAFFHDGRWNLRGERGMVSLSGVPQEIFRVI